MEIEDPIAHGSETIHVRLTLGQTGLEGAFALQTGRQPKRVILPVLHRLADSIVQIAEAGSGEAAAAVTCRKGCDACCRQMVPLAPTEAHGLAETLGRMTPAAAQRVLARFERGMEALDKKGILDRLRKRSELTPEELERLDRDYFAAQVPCPFLERRACMIHAERPLPCREFVVTSDPHHCTTPGEGQMRRVELPAKPSVALCQSDGGTWVPLILAREFTAQRSETVGVAADALRDVLAKL
jgi:Fe-S-cluster containining protein